MLPRFLGTGLLGPWPYLARPHISPTHQKINMTNSSGPFSGGKLEKWPPLGRECEEMLSRWIASVLLKLIHRCHHSQGKENSCCQWYTHNWDIIRGIAAVALELMGWEQTFPVAVHSVWHKSASGMALALVVTILVISVRRSPNLQQELGQGKMSFLCGFFHVCLQGQPYCSFLQGDMLACFLYPPSPLSIISQLPSQSWQQYIGLQFWMCQTQLRMAKEGSKSYWVEGRKGQ